MSEVANFSHLTNFPSGRLDSSLAPSLRPVVREPKIVREESSVLCRESRSGIHCSCGQQHVQCPALPHVGFFANSVAESSQTLGNSPHVAALIEVVHLDRNVADPRRQFLCHLVYYVVLSALAIALQQIDRARARLRQRHRGHAHAGVTHHAAASAFRVELETDFPICVRDSGLVHPHVADVIRREVLVQPFTVSGIGLIARHLSTRDLREHERGHTDVGPDVHDSPLAMVRPADASQLVAVIRDHFGDHVV